MGQAGPEMAEVLAPEDVARRQLRVGPGENVDRATVAYENGILRQDPSCLDHEACRMNRPGARRDGFEELLAERGTLLFPSGQLDWSGAGRRFQRIDQLRDDIAKIAHQWRVNMAIYANRERIPLDIDPLADIAFRPMASHPVVDRLANFGSGGDDKIGFRDDIGSHRRCTGKCDRPV